MHEDRVDDRRGGRRRRRRSPGPSTGRAGAAAARTEALALDALSSTRPRYAVVAAAAGLAFPDVAAARPRQVETVARRRRARTSASRRAITDVDRRPVDAAEADAARRARRGRLDVLRPGRRRRAGRAAQGPARRRPRPRQDVRPRRSRPTGATPGDRASSVRSPTPTDRAAVDGDARRDARRPRASRPTARRSPAASGRRATPRAGSPGTPSTTPGRSRTAPSR